MNRDATLTIRDYLETTSDSSKRTRTVTIVLVVATVLTFVGYLNSRRGVWLLDRISKVADRDENYIITKLGEPPSEELVREQYKPVYIRKRWVLVKQERFDSPEGPYAEEIRAFKQSDKINELLPEEKEKLYKGKFKELDETYNKAHEDLYGEMVKAYVDNSLLARAPFFGITFDVNDLYLLSGVALIVILLLLRFNLGRELSNLKLSFREAENQLEPFYHLLAMRQVFTFPSLPEYTRPAVLRFAPYLIVLMPSVIYFLLWRHDNFITWDIAVTLNPDLAWWMRWLGSIFLGVILILTFLCIRTWHRIDKVWADQWKILNPEPPLTKENSEENGKTHEGAAA